jgi:hypothetical protein
MGRTEPESDRVILGCVRVMGPVEIRAIDARDGSDFGSAERREIVKSRGWLREPRREPGSGLTTSAIADRSRDEGGMG